MHTAILACRQRSGGIMDMYDTRVHTQLWFPQVAALSLQSEDLSEALFNTDVKMSVAWRGGRRVLVSDRDVGLTPPLIDKQTGSQFNPLCLTGRLLNEQVEKQLNWSSCSCSRGLWGQMGFVHFEFGAAFSVPAARQPNPDTLLSPWPFRMKWDVTWLQY